MAGSPIASLFVQIGADISQLQQGLATAEKSMQTSAGAFANMANQNQAAYEAANAVQRRFYSGAEQTTQSLSKQGEVLGMTRREFSQTGSAAVFALSAIGGKAVEANAQLAGVVGAAMQLGQALAFGTGIGVALTVVALAVGALMTALDKSTPQIKAFKTEIDNLAKTDDAVRGLMQLASVSEKQAQQMLEVAKSNREYAQALKDATKEQDNFFQRGVAGWALIGQKLNEFFLSAIPGLKMFNDLGKEVAWNMREQSTAQAQNLQILADLAPAYAEQIRLEDLMKNAIIEGTKENKRYREELDKLAEAHQKTMDSLAGGLAKLDIQAGADRIKVAADTNKEIERLNEDLGKRIGDIQAGLADRMKEMDYQRNEQLEQFAKDAANIEKNYTKDSRANEKDKQKSLADLSKDTAKSIKELEKQKAKDLTGVETNRVKSLAQLDLETKKNLARAKSQVERDAVMEDAKDQREAIEAEAAARIKEVEDAAKERKQAILDAAEERRQEIELRAAERRSEIEAQRKEQLEQLEERKKEASERFEHEKLLAKQQADAQIAQAKRANDEQIKQAKAREKEQIDAINARLDEEKRAIEERKNEELAAYQATQIEASKTHKQRMAELMDFSTEEQKLQKIINSNRDASIAAIIAQYQTLNTQGVATAAAIRTAFSDPASVTAGESIMNNLSTGINNKKSLVQTAIDNAIAGLTWLTTTSWNQKGQDVFNLLKGGFDLTTSGLQTSINAGLNWLHWVMDTTGWGTQAQTIFNNLKGGFDLTASGLQTAITAGISWLSWVSDTTGWGAKAESIFNDLKSGFNTTKTALRGAIDAGISWLPWLLDSTARNWYGEAQNIWQQLTAGFNSVKSQITGAIAGALQQLIDLLNNLMALAGLDQRSITNAFASSASAPLMPSTGSMPSVSLPSINSGVTVNFYYSPDVSLATRDEAQNTIAPMVVAAVLDAQRRGLLAA